MLELSNVEKWYNDSPVIRGVSFSVGKGEIVGLTGPSGSGKSVLLKLIGKVERPDAGTISVGRGDEEIEEARVGFLFQEGAPLQLDFPSLKQ